MFKNVLAAATSMFVVLCSSSSFAAPFVDIRANFSASTIPELSSQGLAVSCRGDATGSFNGCTNELSLRRMPAESGVYKVTSTGSLVITNTADDVINGFVGLDIVHSAFNPGGPENGIGIDNFVTQAASFRSSVTGPGAGDTQTCAVGFRGDSGYVTSPTTCGVAAPDSSFTNTGAELVNFLPGAEIVFTWVIDITAMFEFGDSAPSGVPEPGSMALVLMGLGGLAWKARRRKV